MHYFFILLRYHASTCFGSICSPSSGGRVYNVALVLVFLLNRLSASPPTVDLEEKQVPFAATLYTWLSDDGLQMGPKHVEAW
jgi:hypothetical protein